MEVVKQTQKKITQQALWLSIIAGLVLILLGYKPVGKGIILGTLFSVLNFIFMAKSIGYKLGRSKRQIFSISIGSLIFRYILLAIPLIAAVKFEQFNLAAVIVGVFMVQIVILAGQLLTQIPAARGKNVS